MQTGRSIASASISHVGYSQFSSAGPTRKAASRSNIPMIEWKQVKSFTERVSSFPRPKLKLSFYSESAMCMKNAIFVTYSAMGLVALGIKDCILEALVCVVHCILIYLLRIQFDTHIRPIAYQLCVCLKSLCDSLA